VNRRELLVAAAATPLALALPERATAGSAGGTPTALVTADTESHVVALDLSHGMAGRVLRRIRTMPGPRSIEGAFMTWAVVAHTASGRLSILYAPTLTVRRVVGGFREPRYTAINPFSYAFVDPGVQPLAYVTDSALRQLVTVDVVRGTILWRTRMPGPARHVTASPDGASLWTALGTKAEKIAVIDLEDPRRPRLVRTITPPFLAHDVVFAPDRRYVWVTSGDSRSVAVYERGGSRPVALLDAGAPPQHVAFHGSRAFVASGDDGTVRLHRPDGVLLHEARVPIGSYNVTLGWPGVITPSLGRGTLALLDARGRVRQVSRVARAAHDACLVVTA
jgi:DNA-binding beta-propeller fold protein YncE